MFRCLHLFISLDGKGGETSIAFGHLSGGIAGKVLPGDYM
jgi:hypothetical protein